MIEEYLDIIDEIHEPEENCIVKFTKNFDENSHLGQEPFSDKISKSDLQDIVERSNTKPKLSQINNLQQPFITQVGSNQNFVHIPSTAKLFPEVKNYIE